MLLLAGLALLGFPLVLLPFMVLLSFSRPYGLGFLDSHKIKLFELFADGRVLDANKSGKIPWSENAALACPRNGLPDSGARWQECSRAAAG